MTIDVALNHRLAAFTLDVGFTVSGPGITVLFGPSGSGKSTTISAIAGLLQPERGRVSINGEFLLDTERGLFVPVRKRRIGYVFQEGRLFPHMSVRSNLLFGWRRSRPRPHRQEIEHVVELLGVGPLLGRRPHTLSGGERQRVALGRALLSNPKLLLLDEPLAALDEARKAEIMPYLERLRDEARMPILYVSHSVDEVSRLANQIIVLSEGRVAAQGAVIDVMTRLDLFPITGRFEAGAVIEARIARHDERDSLTEVVFDGGRLTVPKIDRAVGETVRIRIRARDVIVALTEPRDISANNVLPATVVEIRSDPGAYADVKLACGAVMLMTRITRRSLERLALAPGGHVFAIVKSVAIDRRSISASTAPSSDAGLHD